MRKAILVGTIFTLLLFAFEEVNGLAQDFTGTAALSIPTELQVLLTVITFYAPLLLGLAVISDVSIRGEYRWLLPACGVLGVVWWFNPAALAPLLASLIASSAAEIVSGLLVKFALPVLALVYSWRLVHEVTAVPGASHQTSSQSSADASAASPPPPSDPMLELTGARVTILLVHSPKAVDVAVRRPRRGVAIAVVRCPNCRHLVGIPVNSIDRAAASEFGSVLFGLAALVIWQYAVGMLRFVFADLPFETVVVGNAVLALIGFILFVWSTRGVPDITDVSVPWTVEFGDSHVVMGAGTKLRQWWKREGRIVKSVDYSPVGVEPERYTR